VKTFLKEHSRTFLFLNTQGALLKGMWKHAAAPDNPDVVSTAVPAEVLQRGYALTRRLLLEMNELARRRNARFAIVMVPYPEDLISWRPVPWSEELREFIAAFCGKSGIPFVDLTAAFRDANGRGVRLNYADGHWNPAGHHLAAELLLQSG
jgi:hypothetical protein